MSPKYRVQWTHTAEADLESVIDYIARENPNNAFAVLKKIKKRASTLKSHPQRGRTLPELSHLPGLPYREIIITPWRLIYHIGNREVQILAFLDSRRDLEDLLYERLI